VTYLPDLVVRGRRIVTARGIHPGAIHIRNGRIIGILDIDDVPAGCPVDDAGADVVLPGLVDTSVHVSEDGQMSPEDFDTATRAAAAGGVTTIIGMPFQGARSTTTVGALESACWVAEGHCFVDVGFWGAVVPGNESVLASLFEAGVLGFHCMLSTFGSADAVATSETDLHRSMPALTQLVFLLAAIAAVTALLFYTLSKSKALADFLDSVSDERLSSGAKMRALVNVWRSKRT